MFSSPSGSAPVFGVGALIAALFLLAAPSPAQAQPHRCGSRVVGTVVGPRRLYFKATPGVRCRTAHRLIRTYFHRAKKGLCVGSGCFIYIRGWECHSAPAAVEVSTGQPLHAPTTAAGYSPLVTGDAVSILKASRRANGGPARPPHFPAVRSMEFGSRPARFLRALLQHGSIPSRTTTTRPGPTGPFEVSTMSRDICVRCRGTSHRRRGQDSNLRSMDYESSRKLSTGLNLTSQPHP